MYFKIKNLRKIVLFGYMHYYNKLIAFNTKNGIETIVFQTKKNSEIKCKNFTFSAINKSTIKKIGTYSKDDTLFISLGLGYIFKKNDINKYFKGRLINFHNTRLPFNKGRTCLSWQILNQDRIFTSSIHLINSKIDEGDILYQNSSVIPKSLNTPLEIQNFDDNQTIKNYQYFISGLKKGNKFKNLSFPKEIGSYNYPLNTEKHGYINWNLTSIDLKNFITAFDDPYKGASTFLNSQKNKRIYIKKVQLHGGEPYSNSFNPGTIIRNDLKWLVVSCNGNFKLLIEEVLNEKGENIISKIKVGHRFVTPDKFLFKSYERIDYNKK